MTEPDPITLAVLAGRLEQIADEMDATLFRSAFNPTIAEARDASHGLYDAASGETLAQGKAGLPIFVGVMAFAVRATIACAETSDGFADGDVFIFNDPYDGGTHLSDFKLVRPYFRGGRLFCHLASVGHWHDVGGNVPGNYNPEATECFQEGVLIPPVRLHRGGVLQQDVQRIILANSRLPATAFGDLSGQLGALDLGVRRLDALIDEYGEATVIGAFAALRARAARLMRTHLASLPDGTYSAEDFLDNDGAVDAPLRIAADVSIDGESMTIDFSRTAPACRGPLNIARSTAIASCYVGLKHIFRDVPANAGVLDPVKIVIPEGSLLDAHAPLPVGGYTETILRIIDVLFVALSKAAPTAVPSPAYGTINALSITGRKPDGVRWVMFSFFGGGHGGHSEGDGLNHGNAPISTATIPPVEILEAANPVLFRRYALREGSGGAGTHRGGLGAIYEIELLADEAEVFLFGERGRFPPPGIEGGEPGALNRFTVLHGEEEVLPAMASKLVRHRIGRGDRLRLETPGGGGYGPPAARPAAAIAQDRALGYVGTEHAS